MKITITLEDKLDGSIHAELNPPGARMAQMIRSGAESTPAMGLALSIANAISKLSKRFSPGKKSDISKTLGLWTPGKTN